MIKNFVCNIAAGITFLVWPPICVILGVGVIVSVSWLVDHFHLPQFPKFIPLVLTVGIIVAWWILYGIKSAKWVKRTCEGQK